MAPTVQHAKERAAVWQVSRHRWVCIRYVKNGWATVQLANGAFLRVSRDDLEVV